MQTDANPLMGEYGSNDKERLSRVDHAPSMPPIPTLPAAVGPTNTDSILLDPDATSPRSRVYHS